MSLWCVPAFGVTTTTVQDTLFGPGGALVSGTITITANSTFTAADGTVVPQGTVTIATVTAGAFSVALVPNTGGTPSGSSYSAVYRLGSVVLSETWVVPVSAPPVGLSGVRTSPPPSPQVMLAASQLLPPSPCTTGQLMTWNGSNWTCTTVSGTGTVTSVGLAAPSEFTVSGSPVTVSGTLTFSKNNQNANLFYAGPASGAAAAPAFRGFALGDLGLTTRGDLLTVNATPALTRLGLGTNGQCLTSNGSDAAWGACGGGSGTVTSFSAGNFSPVFNTSVATPTTTPALSFSAINQNANLLFAGPSSGPAAAPAFRAMAAADVPAGSSCGANNFANGINAALAPACAQPSVSNLSGLPVTVGQGGTGQTAAGSSGQVLISNGSTFAPGDPIVSYAYTNLLNAASATATASSSAVRVPTFSGFGTLYVTYASITGSPAGCTLQLKNADSLGNLINNGSAISTTPANGTTTSAILSASGFQTAAQVAVAYSCTTYPTAGTVSVDYSPGHAVGVVNTPSVAQSGTWTVQPGNTANTTPWLVNANQNGTWTVQPGNTANTTPWLMSVPTWAGGTLGAMANYGTSPGAVLVPGVNAFITNTPPVSQSGTWTVQPGNTQNTTAWLTQDAANGSVTAGAAAGKSELTGCQFNTSLPTLTNGQQAAIQCDSTARLLIGLIASALPTGSNTIGAVTQASGPWSSNLTQVNSAAVATSASGVQKVGITGNAGASVDAATGAAPPANAVYIAGKDQSGNAQAFFVDPCQDASLTRASANINQTASAQLITGAASKQTYICSLNLVSATAQNVALVEGTGSVCATGIAGMAGGTTAATGWNLSANGGLVSNGVGYWVFKTATAADNVCLLQSGTGQISGNITSVQK